MVTFQYTIRDALGIHARPAGVFVKKAKESQSEIIVSKGDKKTDAKKLFGLMGLAVKEGDTITVEVEGPDETTTAQTIQDFLAEQL